MNYSEFNKTEIFDITESIESVSTSKVINTMFKKYWQY